MTKQTFGKCLFLLPFILAITALSVSAKESAIPDGVDVGDMKLRAAAYKISNYDEYTQSHPKGHDPAAMGITYLPERIRFSMAGHPELVMKFRQLGLRNCFVGFWKEGFEVQNTELFAKAAKAGIPIILHNVTANKNGHCYFETFSTETPLTE